MLGGELGEHHRRDRRGVTGLDHHGVACGDRGTELPDRHHHRVVPRRHLADDADRLTADPRGVVLHVLACRLALQHPCRTGEEPDLVDHRRDLLGHGDVVGLAGVAALRLDECLSVLLDIVGEVEQRLLPVRRCGALPVLERLRRGGVGVVDVGLVGDRRAAVLLAGARVDQRHRGAADGVDELAADEVLNLGHINSCR